MTRPKAQPRARRPYEPRTRLPGHKQLTLPATPPKSHRRKRRPQTRPGPAVTNRPAWQAARDRNPAPVQVGALGVNGAAKHRAKTTSAMIAARRQKALDLLVAGHAYGSIARETGVSTTQVCWDIRAILAEIEDDTADLVKKYKTLSVRRLERLLAAWWPKAIGASVRRPDGQVVHYEPEKAAADVVRGILGDEADLLGLKAPAKVAFTDPTGTRPYGEMSDAELDARWVALEAAERGQAERKALAAAPGLPDLDVAPVEVTGGPGGALVGAGGGDEVGE